MEQNVSGWKESTHKADADEKKGYQCASGM